MKKQLRTIAVLLCLLQFAGCTSMQPVESAGAGLAGQLEVGDRVVIYEKTGRVVDMTLSAIDGDRLRGALTANPERAVEVTVGEIEKIELERVDGGRTVLAVLGGSVAGVVVLVTIILLAAIF